MSDLLVSALAFDFALGIEAVPPLEELLACATGSHYYRLPLLVSLDAVAAAV